MIVELRAENFQRLKAIQIRPTGRVVRLTGGNDQGKTSILQAIAAAIKGKPACPTDPIRDDCDKAWISLDLGDKVVRRTFTRGKDGEPYTTSLIVEAKVEGGKAKLGSPQQVIDSLMADISFDPLIFLGLPPAKQVDALRRFVSGFDFVANAQANARDKLARTDANRKAREATLRAEGMGAFPADLPAERINEQALLDQLTNAAATNGAIERERQRRTNEQGAIEGLRSRVERKRDEIASLENQISILRGEISETEREIANRQQLLDDTPLPGEPIDVSDVSVQMTRARQINALIGDRETRDRLVKEAATHEFEAESYDSAIEKREQQKRDAIAAAKLPVEGLDFTDDGLLYKGHPFEQASMAVRLKVGVALAMASNPRLRVLRIRDGSLLDEKSMATITEMAEANDFQVWVELVDTSGRVGFVVEDGTVRQAEAA